MTMPYNDSGTGKPIVLLHSFPLSKNMWKLNTNDLVEASFRVIAPDFRGFGQNQYTSETLLMEDLAKDVINLLDSLKIDKAIVCGLSMGGYVAFSIFNQFPERVSALIFCSTTHENDSIEKKKSRYELIDGIKQTGISILANKMLPNLLSNYTLRERIDIRKELERKILKTKSASAIAALRGMAMRPDFTDMLPKIDVPCLLVFGDDDKVTTLKVANVLNNRIANSNLKVIRNAGHYANIENPKDFNAALTDFLNSL